MKKYLYDDLYELEDTHWWHISKREICIYFLNHFSSVVKAKILDIGCGTGKNVEELNKIGKAWGVDVSRDAIAYCKRRGLRSVTLGKAEKTKFPSNYFDIVTLLDVLEHTNDKKTLREVYRILKPGGIMLLTVPAYAWLWSEWDVVLHHKRRYTKKNMNSLLEKQKFNVLKISYMYSFLVIPIYLIRLIKSILFPHNYPSDFQLSSPLINKFLLIISRGEAFFVKYSYIPLGTSIISVAKK